MDNGKARKAGRNAPGRDLAKIKFAHSLENKELPRSRRNCDASAAFRVWDKTNPEGTILPVFYARFVASDRNTDGRAVLFPLVELARYRRADSGF